MQGGSTARSTEEDKYDDVSYISYIIGAFNILIAVLSALSTFLKYDALEDRHHQYSRHFGNLKIDLETLLSQPESSRGNASGTIEKYRIKYAVLMNNAPDLPVELELCCIEGVTNCEIEMT